MALRQDWSAHPCPIARSLDVLGDPWLQGTGFKAGDVLRGIVSREVDAMVKNDPNETSLCANLARAEKILEEDAADEKKKTGVFSHVLCVLANLASSAVIVIGTLSILVPSIFIQGSGIDGTVWSYYGYGYLFIPLALPVLGMLWLRSRRALVAGS